MTNQPQPPRERPLPLPWKVGGSGPDGRLAIKTEGNLVW